VVAWRLDISSWGREAEEIPERGNEHDNEQNKLEPPEWVSSGNNSYLVDSFSGLAAFLEEIQPHSCIQKTFSATDYSSGPAVSPPKIQIHSYIQKPFSVTDLFSGPGVFRAKICAHNCIRNRFFATDWTSAFPRDIHYIVVFLRQDFSWDSAGTDRTFLGAHIGVTILRKIGLALATRTISFLP